MSYPVLLAIFLAVEWSSPHAHLTGTHEHGGDRHQHSAEVHVHQPVAQHPDAIDDVDLAHDDTAERWVVDMDHAQLPSRGQQSDTSPIGLVAHRRIPVTHAPNSSGPFGAPNLLPYLLPAHIGQPRAPPQLA